MKKIYNMPDVTITCVELQQMIAISGDPEDSFKTTDASRTLDTGISGGNMSRGNSIWDEEEEY